MALPGNKFEDVYDPFNSPTQTSTNPDVYATVTTDGGKSELPKPLQFAEEILNDKMTASNSALSSKSATCSGCTGEPAIPNTNLDLSPV